MVHGKRLTFQVAGIWKLTLMITDEQTGSIWAHAEGIAVEGPLKGTHMERHPCFQSTWEEWLWLHPDTEVLTWPDNRLHRDGRHGHGSRDYLGRPGIRAGRAFGLDPGLLDNRLPENAMVLGVNHPSGDTAYPLNNIHISSGVVNDTLGEDPVVVWSPRLDSHLTAGYSRDIDGAGILTFSVKDGEIRDTDSGSLWSIEGMAIEGALVGRKLKPLDALFLKWHAWSNFHPLTTIYKSKSFLAESEIQSISFSFLLKSLKGAGYQTRIEGYVIKAILPNLANAGIIIWVDDDRFFVYEFRDHQAAVEYCYAQSHFLLSGHFTLKSEPEVQFADFAQLKPLPTGEISWSKLLDDPRFVDLVKAALFPDEKSPKNDATSTGFPAVFEKLIENGYKIEGVKQIDIRRLRFNSENGFEVTINEDPFLIYRFRSPETAKTYSASHEHSISVENYVFRSDPPYQYKHQGLKSIDLPIDEIEWSKLLVDDDFIRVLESIIRC